jgi:AcrR family transcriptional regulator
VSTPAYLTAKGDARARLIINATLRCLARDGYAGASIQRIADEAGIPKRSVLYYYGTRDQLFAHVVSELVARIVAQIRTAVDGLDRTSEIIGIGFHALWGGLTEDRGLIVAWFGLQTEAITNPQLRPVAAQATGRLRSLFSQLITEHLARGGMIRMAPATLQVLVLAGIQGLALEWLEGGETPQLADAISEFQAWVLEAAS